MGYLRISRNYDKQGRVKITTNNISMHSKEPFDVQLKLTFKLFLLDVIRLLINAGLTMIFFLLRVLILVLVENHKNMDNSVTEIPITKNSKVR